MSISHYRGDTWCRTWLFRDSAGEPIPLTGAVARLQLRDATGAIAADGSTADGSIAVDGPAGRIDLRIEAGEMILPVGTYRFDLEVTYSDGLIQTVDQNTLTIVEDITHD